MWYVPKCLQYLEVDGLQNGFRLIEFYEQHDEYPVIRQLLELGVTNFMILEQHCCYCTKHLLWKTRFLILSLVLVISLPRNSTPPPPPPPGSTQQTLNGEASPRGPHPYPFIYHFWQEMYPFPAHTSWQMVPSHVPNLNPSVSRFKSFHKPQWQISPTFHTDFDDKFYADLLAITEVLR